MIKYVLTSYDDTPREYEEVIEIAMDCIDGDDLLEEIQGLFFNELWGGLSEDLKEKIYENALATKLEDLEEVDDEDEDF